MQKVGTEEWSVDVKRLENAGAPLKLGNRQKLEEFGRLRRIRESEGNCRTS